MSASRRQKLIAWTAPMAIEAVSLGRSIILARAIGPEEFGRAMLLALVLRLVEMLSDMGFERLLVQAPEGDTPELQAQLQGALILRGAAMSLVLLGLAPLLAIGFPDGPAAQSYAILAAIPALRAFLHLDYRRYERAFNYRGLAIVELGAGLAMLAALGAAFWGGLTDHRVLIAALLAQVGVQVALSHLLAERPWRLSFSRPGLARIWRFGAPLTLNAGLMFLMLQADRFIVAWAWDWSDLAIYGTVAQLSLLPALIYGRISNSLLLPGFGKARAAGTLSATARRALWQSAGLGLLLAAGFALIAPGFIAVVYGAEMRPGHGLALAFGLAAGLRTARTPLSVLAVATARTGDPARANLWRAAMLLPGTALAGLGAPLVAFVATSALGEALAYLRGWQLTVTKSDAFAAPAQAPDTLAKGPSA